MNELKFGNSIYSVEFNAETMFRVFGHQYNFKLLDAIDGCVEYLVHFPTLIKYFSLVSSFIAKNKYKMLTHYHRRMAQAVGFVLILDKTFHTFYEEHISDQHHRRLMKRLNILNNEGTVTDDEWEAIGMYKVFAFRKK